MSRIHLVRHGQASLLADDYDQLSALGETQARRLGEWFAACDTHFSVAACGTLKRQLRTATPILEAAGGATTLSVDGAFDEYSHDEVFANAEPEYATHASISRHLRGSATARQDFQRAMASAFGNWVRGDDDARRPRSWASFRAGAVDALERVAARCASREDALVVTSGGVITALCQHLTGIPDDRIADLHWMIHNGSITRLLCRPGAIALSSFNSVAHFERDVADRALVTYR